jgi:formamidopyrimidine-DNA glycosylase
MPELPEVETIRLGLQRYIVGKTIRDVKVRLAKIVTGDPKDIIGAKVIDVRRFGKGLVIDLDNGYSIAIHIKLTGQLIYKGPEIPTNVHLSPKTGGVLPNKWTHVIFKLKAQKSKVKTTTQNSKVRNDWDAYLYYNDLRQFGWIKIVQSSKLKDQSFFKDLGPEFFKDLDLEKFKAILSKSNLAIKVLIMDQKKMSGVGNIYANDALFEARIDPRRKAKDLSEIETEKLYNSILKVLKKGLEQGGATELNFVNVLGQEGGYQNHFLVYGREKEPCRVCKTPIQKIKLGGRGTYFCPNCQR